jgi:hypothetical protein
MTILGKRINLPVVPGVNPLEDSTPLNTILFTDSDKIRFQNGKLRKIGGWERIFASNQERITGAARNIFSCRDKNGDPVTIIGTNTRLYAFIPDDGQNFYNITPLKTNAIPLPNAFTTEYNASVNVPFSTVRFSTIVTLTIRNYFQNFDQITISGVTGTYGGIPDTAINGTFAVNATNNSTIQLTLNAPATVTGNFIVNMTWSAGYLYVSYPSNGLPEGDRIGILGSTDVGNIQAAAINIEQVITNLVSEDVFVIQTGVVATSLVLSGGGNAITIQTQIDPGNIDQSSGYGYGGGPYGNGPYGDSKTFNTPSVVVYPRIWSMDKYGSDLIVTPGDGAINVPNLYV